MAKDFIHSRKPKFKLDFFFFVLPKPHIGQRPADRSKHRKKQIEKSYTMFRSLEINVTVAWPRAPAPRKGAGRPRLPKWKSAGVTESTIAGPCIWLASFLRTPSRRRNEIRALRKLLLSRVYCPVFFSSGWIRPREAAGRSRHTEKSSPTGDSHDRDRSIGRPRMLKNRS